VTFNLVSLIQACSNIFFAATFPGVQSYLSDKYIISLIPDWIITLAHSLQGNSATYIFQSFKFLHPLFKTAFTSA
jgi:hypothetical protein